MSNKKYIVTTTYFAAIRAQLVTKSNEIPMQVVTKVDNQTLSKEDVLGYISLQKPNLHELNTFETYDAVVIERPLLTIDIKPV